MTNSEDTDQTAPWSSLISVFTVLSVLSVLILRVLWYVTVKHYANILRGKYFDMVSEG